MSQNGRREPRRGSEGTERQSDMLQARMTEFPTQSLFSPFSSPVVEAVTLPYIANLQHISNSSAKHTNATKSLHLQQRISTLKVPFPTDSDVVYTPEVVVGAEKLSTAPKEALSSSSESNPNKTDASRPCDLPVLVHFGIISDGPDNGVTIENASPHFPGFPCVMSNVRHRADLAQLQRNHFALTYKCHELTISDVVGYGIAFFNPQDSKYSMPKLGLDDADWEVAIQEVLSSHQSNCSSLEQCGHSLQPTKVVILFSKTNFYAALRSRNIDPQMDGLRFLDAFNEDHAYKLASRDWNSFLHYSHICKNARESRLELHSEFHEGVLDTLKASTPRYFASLMKPPRLQNDIYGEINPTANQAMTFSKTKKRSRPSTQNLVSHTLSSISSVTPLAKNRLDSICGPKGYRLIAENRQKRPPSPEAYLGASERPYGYTKRESDSCLTCIRFGRRCKGTMLVEVHGQLRCQYCATKHKGSSSGSRRCYWKHKAKGILTYDDAKEADSNKIVNVGNTREAKRRKAEMKFALKEQEKGNKV